MSAPLGEVKQRLQGGFLEGGILMVRDIYDLGAQICAANVAIHTARVQFCPVCSVEGNMSDLKQN